MDKDQGRAIRKFPLAGCLPAGRQGYGAFSVNPADIRVVSEYIENQTEHHKKIIFQDEYRKFLKEYEVDYDERYVWD